MIYPAKIIFSYTKFFIISFFIALTAQSAQGQLSYKNYLHKPKLVVVLVIDQFRADYLSRLQNQFLPAGSKDQPGGFEFLASQGAYFPFAEYEVFQSMTCPGHAMILTGSYPELNGIPLNEWYDQALHKMRYCVDSEKYGISPENLKTSTVSDEYKMTHPESKVFSMALKDRSAVLLGGHLSNRAIWYDAGTSHWASSNYYGTGTPAWMEEKNKELSEEKGRKFSWKTHFFDKSLPMGSKLALASPYGTKILFRLAKSAVQSEKLGQNINTDFLFMSLSNHDYVGHMMGPLSREIEALTLAEDREISDFLKYLRLQLGGLKNVVVVLTADHGVSPLVEDLKNFKLDAGRLDYLALHKNAGEALTKKYGSPEDQPWFSASHSLHFYLNRELLTKKKIPLKEALEVVRKVFLAQQGVWKVFTHTDYEEGRFPVGELGEQLKRQYLPSASGDLVLIPRPFYMEKDENQTTHMTGFSYDRQVPLIIFGANIKPSVHLEQAKIIDLATTLSSILGSTAPAGSFGKPLPIF